MDDKEFREIVKSLPSYQRLSFIHGERLFIRDADSYRITSIQALYEMVSRPVGMIVTSEKLSKQQREELLAESDGYTPMVARTRSTLTFDFGLPARLVPPDLSNEVRNGLITDIDITAIGDGEPKQIRPIICSRGQQIWCDRDEHPDCFERLKISEDEDHLTDDQVWLAIGIMILLILIILFSVFPNP